MGDQGLASFNHESILDRFQRKLDEIVTFAPMLGGYERITPYIRDFDRNGQKFSLIIFHKESQAWFDNENAETSFIALEKHKVLRRGDIVFDLGCNVGFNLCWYAMSVGQEGHIYGFDPFPWNAAAVRFNAELNSLSNVTVYQVGIGARRETINLSLTDARLSIQGPYSIDAEICPLGHFSHLKPSVLKIDIEGSEFDLCQGGLRDLDAVRFCFLELHPSEIERRGLDPHFCLQAFVDIGFDVFESLDDPGSAYSADRPLVYGYYMRRRGAMPDAPPGKVPLSA